MAIVRNALVDDSNDIEKSTESDDLASFGTLSSPDTEGAEFAPGADSAEIDLASLASSTKANQNGHSEPTSTEGDSRIDLSQATEPIDDETVPEQETVCEPVEQPPDNCSDQPIDDETVPEQETVCEPVEQPSDTSKAQSVPIAQADVPQEPEPKGVDNNKSKTGQTHWALILSIGFILGLSAASISIFIFFSMDRSQSNAPVSSTAMMASNQRTATPTRTSESADLSSSRERATKSAQPDRANAVIRPTALDKKNIDAKSRRRRAPISARIRERETRSVDPKVEIPPVAQAVQQPISSSNEPDKSAGDKPSNPTPTAGVTASKKSPQPTPVTNADLDKIIDRVLDATEEDNIKRSAAQKERQKNAPQPPEQLPLAPSREQVTEAMAVLLPAIRGCAKGLSGLATANLIVLNSGKVASVTVSGSPFAGTASGHCIEAVVRNARFPRFRQPTFRVRFPFSIRGVSP